MRVTILTQYYPPEIGAPQARLSELASALVRRGHEVTVLTAMPSYPVGKIYPGYGGFLSQERRGGARVIRTPIFPTQRADFLGRLANYFSFACSAGILGTFLLRRCEYLIVESPPLFLGFTGLWLSWRTRAAMVFNVSDLWPETAVRLGVVRAGSLGHRIAAWLEGLCYRHAAVVKRSDQDDRGERRGAVSRVPHLPLLQRREHARLSSRAAHRGGARDPRGGRP